jgi:hypothetical protein
MKRSDALRALSDDHHDALVLARACQRAARAEPATRAAAAARAQAAFTAQLEPHFAIEERHLLPALIEIGEAALAERIRADHAALRTLRDAGLGDAQRLADFGAHLAAHVRFEERQVFEPTQTRLPSTALAAIAAACQALRSTR